MSEENPPLTTDRKEAIKANLPEAMQLLIFAANFDLEVKKFVLLYTEYLFGRNEMTVEDLGVALHKAMDALLGREERVKKMMRRLYLLEGGEALSKSHTIERFKARVFTEYRRRRDAGNA
jgi:hypothetical protein